MPDHSPATRLELPGNLSYLPLALTFIVESARIYPFTPDELSRIRLASEEAVANIMQHALCNSLQEQFSIACCFRDGHFEIVIHEKGTPFDPSAVPEYRPEEISAEGDAAGLGLFLMKQSMDEIRFRNLGRDGKETVLIKYLEKERIDHLTPFEPAGAETLPSGSFEYRIRDFADADAIGIAQCAYAAYGYSYESYIYYPSRIVRMNRRGQMISMIAESGSKVAGHIALKFADQNRKAAELGVGIVKPEFRRKGILKDLMLHAIARAGRVPELKVLFGRAVAAHTRSQQAAGSFGMIPAGIQLALFPADVDFKSLAGRVAQKDSALTLVLNLSSDGDARTVFVPERHREMIERILERMEMPALYGTPETPGDPDPGGIVLTSSIMDVFNTGDIYCRQYHSGTAFEIKHALRQFRVRKLDAVYLWLDMSRPGMPAVAEQCERMGFFFSHVAPYGFGGHHALVLQYLNNLSLDFDRIMTADPYAESIKAYIAEEYRRAVLE